MNGSRSGHVWLRVVGGLAAGALIGSVLLAAAAHWWLQRYLHSDAFRRLISAQTSAALRVEGEYLPLHWSGMTAYSDGFYGRGQPGSLLKEVRADQIRAEFAIAGLLRNRWRISGLQVQQLTLKVGSADGRTPEASASTHTAAPLEVRLDPLQAESATVEWTTSHGATGSLRNAKLVVALGPELGHLSVWGGELRLPGVPPLWVEEGKLRFQQETIFVSHSRLRVADGGRWSVSGQISLSEAQESNLTLRYDEVPLERWLPSDWRGRLIGMAHGESRLWGRLGRVEAVQAEGTIELSGARLEALPVLNRLAVFTGSEQFRQVQLQKARAEYHWNPARLIVRRVLLESVGLLRIEGGCVVENNVLNGEFEVGVASATLRWLPGARSRVFTVEREGYQWTKVRVQGPTTDLREDLSGRLLAAAGTEAIESTKDVIQKGAETLLGIFHKLTQ